MAHATEPLPALAQFSVGRQLRAKAAMRRRFVAPTSRQVGGSSSGSRARCAHQTPRRGSCGGSRLGGDGRGRSFTGDTNFLREGDGVKMPKRLVGRKGNGSRVGVASVLEATLFRSHFLRLGILFYVRIKG